VLKPILSILRPRWALERSVNRKNEPPVRVPPTVAYEAFEMSPASSR
jgi:hypothetical protein